MILRLICATLALALSAPAATVSAQESCPAPIAVPETVTTPNATYYSDGMPPARYRGNARATVRFSSQDEIVDLCGRPPCGLVVLACQQHKQLVMPNPCTYGAADKYAKLLCHELGHLNGWPATHGD